MNEETKTCTGCNETKDVSCFSKDKKKSDGLSSRCKACRQAYYETNKDKLLAYCAANKEKRNAYCKARSQTQRGKYSSYKKGAKERSLSFELTFDEFMVFWQQDCSYCGDQIATIGIDRIDSSIGYVFQNCIPCCKRCNEIKMAYSVEETNMHMLKMLKHQGII